MEREARMQETAERAEPALRERLPLPWTAELYPAEAAEQAEALTAQSPELAATVEPALPRRIRK